MLYRVGSAKKGIALEVRIVKALHGSPLFKGRPPSSPSVLNTCHRNVYRVVFERLKEGTSSASPALKEGEKYC